MDSNKDVSVEVLNTICEDCHKKFQTYKLSDFLYGEKLLLTEDGIDFVYLNTFEDPVFDEVGKIYDKFFNQNSLNSNSQIKYFDWIFGLTCDPIRGKRINGLRRPRCFSCGSEQLESMSYEPAEIVILNLPIPTHFDWEQKTYDEKENFIFNTLKSKLPK